MDYFKLYVNIILQIDIFRAIITAYAADANNYGPYSIEYKNCIMCAGPKSKNLTRPCVDLIKINGDYVANVNITFLVQTRVDEVKVRAYAVKKNQKSLLFNYKIDDACKHFAFADVIKKIIGANNCVVKKGNYSFELNLTNLCRTFYGTSTFYGEFQIKATVVSKQGNLLCWVMNQMLSMLCNLNSQGLFALRIMLKRPISSRDYCIPVYDSLLEKISLHYH